MSVTVNCHYFLPHLTLDQETVEVNGTTVGECLTQLATQYPRTKEWLFREDGKLRDFIDININLDNPCPEGLVKPVKDGDQIFIVMMISGG